MTPSRHHLSPVCKSMGSGELVAPQEGQLVQRLEVRVLSGIMTITSLLYDHMLHHA